MANAYDYSLDFTPIQMGLQALQQGNIRRQQQEREDARFKVLQQQQEREQAIFERDEQFRGFLGSEGYSPEEAQKLYPDKLEEIQAHENYRTTLREQGGQRKSQEFYNAVQEAKRTGDRTRVDEYLEQERGLIDATGDPTLNVDAIRQMDLDTLEDMAVTTYRQAGGDVQRLTGVKRLDPYQQAQIDIKKAEAEERKLDRQLTRETNQLRREQIQQDLETARKVKEQKQIATYNQAVDEIDTIQSSIDTVDRVLFHPGRESATGFTGVFPTIPGGEAAGFEAQLETLQSQSFLTAVQQLKGLGALSEKEGDKLQASVGALSLTMPESEFTSELKRIRSTLTKAMTKARQRMPEEPEALARRRQEETPPTQPPTQPQIPAQPQPVTPAGTTRGALQRQQRQQAESGYASLWGG